MEKQRKKQRKKHEWTYVIESTCLVQARRVKTCPKKCQQEIFFFLHSTRANYPLY